MNFHKLGKVTATLAVVLSLVSVPELAHAGKKERNIALGIGLGLLGGAIVSQGDPRAVIGGLSQAASSVVSSQRTIAARGGTTALIGAGGRCLATTTSIDLSATIDCISKEYHCENKNCYAGDCPILGQCNHGPRRGSG
ncbi:hypothetical protein [Agrobacterium arsenijevicii]|uniref:hypothetical protein n=1 Tax=Agrobacterium arsenijevicii TaxID=1585697 RepID=UPI001112313B